MTSRSMAFNSSSLPRNGGSGSSRSPETMYFGVLIRRGRDYTATRQTAQSAFTSRKFQPAGGSGDASAEPRERSRKLASLIFSPLFLILKKRGSRSTREDGN